MLQLKGRLQAVNIVNIVHIERKTDIQINVKKKHEQKLNVKCRQEDEHFVSERVQYYFLKQLFFVFCKQQTSAQKISLPS